MAKKINILVVEPGKAPRSARVRDSLETFQAIVGGPIEIGCYLPQQVMLVCNGEGKNLGLPPNRPHPNARDYIAGTFFLCGLEGEHFASLTPAQQLEFQLHFAKPWEFMMIGTNTMCASPAGLAKAAQTLWENMKHGESVVLTKWGVLEEGAAH